MQKCSCSAQIPRFSCWDIGLLHILTHAVCMFCVCGSVIQFFIKFGCSQQVSNYSSSLAASSSEPVLLRYSTDGGIHWTLIGTYHDQTVATPGSSYVVVKLPYEAKTNSTRLHWWQPIADETHRPDWAIDQVRTVARSPAVARIADRDSCQIASRSSTVDDSRVI